MDNFPVSPSSYFAQRIGYRITEIESLNVEDWNETGIYCGNLVDCCRSDCPHVPGDHLQHEEESVRYRSNPSDKRRAQDDPIATNRGRDSSRGRDRAAFDRRQEFVIGNTSIFTS